MGLSSHGAMRPVVVTAVPQDQLKNVQRIQASKGAFAAILRDGSVMTWGDARRGGDSSPVQEQAEERATDPRLGLRSCRHLAGWVCRHMGFRILRW